MENTTSATTKKVKNYMPYDLAFLITSKLPPKSVKRFGCLCKSWDLNFENPHFMSIFRKNIISNHRSHYDGTSLLLSIDKGRGSPFGCQLYSLFGKKFENKHKLDWPNPFPNDNHFNIWGSCSVNGTLCLYRRIEEVVFWNPATKEFKAIPLSPYVPPLPLVYCHGFGFDNVRNDYKLIRHVNTYSEIEETSFEPFWEIYSLRSNSWKKLDGDAPPSRMVDQVGVGAQLYTEGMCHWWGWGEDKTDNDKDCIILSSFDLGNEVFIATPIISGMEDDLSLWSHLILLNESIASISYYFGGTPTFHISVLGELGVKESWTKLFIVGPLPYIAYPIGAGKKGDLFFMKEEGGEKDAEIVYFDLSTQETHELDVKTYYSRTLVYKESFILMEGINN